MLAVAVAVSVWSPSTITHVFGQMVTALTVLTGFAFNALFSDLVSCHTILPDPKNEGDRVDVARISRLASNFDLRFKLFMPMAISEIILLVFLGLFPVLKNPEGLSLFTASSALAFFLFLECLYVFYRMAETIIAMIDQKRRYLARHCRG